MQAAGLNSRLYKSITFTPTAAASVTCRLLNTIHSRV